MGKNVESTGEIGHTRSRRKEARPAEIIDRAIEVFLEKGFEATRLEEIARRVGVVKGTIYIYFETKEQLFRAVVQKVVLTNVRQIHAGMLAIDEPASVLIPAILAQIGATVGSSRAPAVATLILREAHRVPDLARIWFDEVVLPMIQTLSQVIERSQARGEMREGEAMLHAFSILGPMVMANLYREIFGPLGVVLPDPEKLARQHAQTLLGGLILSPMIESKKSRKKS